MNNATKDRNNGINVRGIVDEHSIRERDSDDLCRKILEKYNYKPVKLLNLENQTFSPSSQFYHPEYGIDDIIFADELPKEDSLNLGKFKPLNYSDNFFASHYRIEYRSDNFSGDLNSIYVKLMRYGSIRKYDDLSIAKYIKRDKESYIKASNENKELPEFLMRKFFDNKYLLGNKNYTDYIFYSKYSIDPEYRLKQAYLVPAEKLRLQVIGILNEMLSMHPENDLIELRKDNFHLNLKIMKAYKIYMKNSDIFEQIEMFKTRSHSLILRIPEDILTEHLKFNKFREIVN